MFSYVAYGLSIHSDLPLPELVPGRRSADVTVRFGSTGFSPQEPPEELRFYRSTDAMYMSRADIGTTMVRDGREIVVDPAPGVEEQQLRLLILGPALAVLLHQRGLLVLHASAVNVAGKVVAFVGESGQGKSTTAAALYAAGHSVVADDVMAVQVDARGGRPIVFPGFPQLKLWPEAAASSLGDTPETLPQIHPRMDKRARRVVRQFPSSSLPLSRIYILDEGETNEIEPLRPQDALMQLIGHSYCAGLIRGTDSGPHFLQCASVVNNVAVAYLKRYRSLSSLSNLVRLVEEDLAHVTEQDVPNAS